MSLLLCSLFKHKCVSRHSSNTIIKFASYTTIVGLITNNNEMVYTEEVSKTPGKVANVRKTKEPVMDFIKKDVAHVPIYIEGNTVKRVRSQDVYHIVLTRFYRCGVESILTECHLLRI